jgi:hypothetical protein
MICPVLQHASPEPCTRHRIGRVHQSFRTGWRRCSPPGGKVNMSATDHMGLDLSAFRMLEIKNGDWMLLY